jgi:hypothetical protein
MKKILFSALGLIIFVGSVSAQRYYPRQRRAQPRYVQPRYVQEQKRSTTDFYTPKIGFAIGANVSNSINSNNSNYNTGSLVGLNVGLTFDLPIIYPLSFAPEVRYSQKGYTVGTASGDFTQRTHFIDVPLLAKFKVAPTFNILVGPQLSYLLSTTNTFDNGFSTSTQQYYANNNGHKTYLDGVVGVSFDISRNVDIHGRYTIDFQATDSNGNTYVPNYRNQVWQFGLGFKF